MDSIEACNEVPAFLYQTCFEGILNGFTQHGEPGNLHPKGYAFCDEFSKVVPSKSSECYENFTNRLKSSYTKEQMIDACMYITADRKVLACAEYMQ